ncbi:MAG: chalcone isomerase family protein [Pseudomonadota bacterium]
MPTVRNTGLRATATRRHLLRAATAGLGACLSYGISHPVSAQMPQPRTVATPGGARHLPPETVADLPQATWSGSARMRFFGFDVYQASLWVPPDFRASRYAQFPLALELTYLRSLRGHSIAQRSLEEMQRAGTHSPTQAQGWLAAMQQAFPDVRAGDRITGLHHPLNGARFWFNGQPSGAVADAEFSRTFFGIWLADSTSAPDLRSALLAGATP